MDRDFVWEGDYGNRLHLLPILKKLLDSQEATSLQLMQAFVNNNPYTLEFYIVISYSNPKDHHIQEMIKSLKNADLIYRPDITANELYVEMANRRFNSNTFIDGEELELSFPYLFEFVEKKVLVENGFQFSGPLGRQFPVFLSHQSTDKAEIEEFIPFLNGKGLPIWFDKYNIDYGKSIVNAVEKGIKSSGAVIFWITPHFLASEWCEKELNSFLNRFDKNEEVLIIPIISSDINTEELDKRLFPEIKSYVRSDQNLKEIANEIIPSIKNFYNEQFKR